MDNELFELCKEVYERTGWREKSYYFTQRYTLNEGMHGDFHVSQLPGTPVVKEDGNGVPLYTSDYLLEKLPTHFKRYNSNYNGYYYKTVMQGHSDGGYLAGYFHNTNRKHTATMNWLYCSGDTDTPLKALLKLTIALHEAKELK